MGKSTISMAIFNSYVKLPEATCNTKREAQQVLVSVIAHMRAYVFLLPRGRSSTNCNLLSPPVSAVSPAILSFWVYSSPKDGFREIGYRISDGSLGKQMQ